MESTKYYKAPAEAGDEDSLCSYANCMLWGKGVERNLKVASELVKLG